MEIHRAAVAAARPKAEIKIYKNDAKRNRPQWRILQKWLKEVTLQTDKMLKTSQTEPSPMAPNVENEPNGTVPNGTNGT